MYCLRYTKYIVTPEREWLLNIYQDRETAIDAVGIGPVLQGLRLVVQGDQADIDTPIVKTSLEMVFVDAPDLEDGNKNGFWEEFYTSSATEWKVELVDETRMCPIWTGYITPDSFSEDLRYRGSVSIIARDNLGTLQDNTCDLTALQNFGGKVYVYEIIEQALKVCDYAMSYSYDYDSIPFSAESGMNGKYELSGSVLWQMVDVQELNNMSWWEALDKVLYSIGAILRYVGNNKLVLLSLRDLPKGGVKDWWDVPTMPTRFVAYGHRELVPGIKDITETQEFDTDADTDTERITKYEGTATLACMNLNLYGPTGTLLGPSFNVPAWGYTNPRTKEQIAAADSSLLNVSNYPRLTGEDSEAYGAWDDESIVYMAVNTREIKPVSFARQVWTSEGKVTIGFKVDKPVSLTSDYSRVMNTPIKGWTDYGTSPTVIVKITHASTTGEVKYYNGSGWQTSETTVSKNLSIGLFLSDKPQGPTTIEWKDVSVPAPGTITVSIERIYITVLTIQLRYDCVGLFMRVRDIHIDVSLPDDIGLLKKLTLTTKYSDKYAVRITRDPHFVINETELPEVAYLSNALLMEGEYQYYGAGDWIWLHGREVRSLQKNTGISLARLNHQQLLAYHASPNNLLTGELVDVDLANPFTALYEWGGVKHMLMSGSLNILTGRMESAVLRSFARYDHMWETYIEEGDVIEVPYSSGSTFLRFVAVSEKQLTGDDITVPEGVINYGFMQEGNKYRWAVWVEPNTTDNVIQQIMTVDTARVLLKRLPAVLEPLEAADGALYDGDFERIYVTQ